MTISMFSRGSVSDDIEPLHMELVGVFDVTSALKNHGPDVVAHFLKNGSLIAMVRSQPYKPFVIAGLTTSIDPMNKTNSTPFGIFVATKEANPRSSRPLLPRSYLDQYRKDFPVLAFSEKWNSWGDVVQFYLHPDIGFSSP
jgi:hypothetical protein